MGIKIFPKYICSCVMAGNKRLKLNFYSSIILGFILFSSSIFAQVQICEIAFNNGNYIKADVKEIFPSGLNVKVLEADEDLNKQIANISEAVKNSSIRESHTAIYVNTIKHIKTSDSTLVNQVKEIIAGTNIKAEAGFYHLTFTKGIVRSSVETDKNFLGSLGFFLMSRFDNANTLGVGLNFSPALWDNILINTSFYSNGLLVNNESTLFNFGVGFKSSITSGVQIHLSIKYSIQHGYAFEGKYIRQSDQYLLFFSTDMELKIYNELFFVLGFEIYPKPSTILGQEGDIFLKAGIGYRIY